MCLLDCSGVACVLSSVACCDGRPGRQLQVHKLRKACGRPRLRVFVCGCLYAMRGALCGADGRGAICGASERRHMRPMHNEGLWMRGALYCADVRGARRDCLDGGFVGEERVREVELRHLLSPCRAATGAAV